MSTVNLTVTDQSPAFLYSPDREGVSASSWQSIWTGSADSSYDITHTQNNIAQGTSSHVTSLAGASVQIDFVGSAVSVFGQGAAGAYSTTLDNGSAVTGSPAGSMLATYGGLDPSTKHTLVLKATSVGNTTKTAVAAGPNNSFITDSFFSTSGNGFSNQHSDQGYTRIDSNSPGAQMSFSVSNTSALLIYGTTNWNHQTFSVEIDPPTGASQGARIFNGTSKWFVLDNLLFWEAGMDPTQNYQVKMTNLISGSYTDLHSVLLMNLPKITAVSASGSASGSASKSTSTSPPTTSATPTKASSGIGKTVGIAVGVVGVLAAMILLAFCFRRRRAQERSKKRMTLDGMVTPFGHPPSSPFVDALHPKDTSFAGSEAPMSLSHFRSQSNYTDSYPNSTSGGANSTYGGANSAYGGVNSAYGGVKSAYGGAPPVNNHAAYTDSAANSAHDLRTVGVGSRHGPQYSELSGSEEFNPYPDNSGLAYLRDSTYAGSSTGQGSRPPSGHVAAPTTAQATTSQASRRPEKGAIPSDTPSARAVRQEVDAGRVPEEEVLPPSYNPQWSQ
ncbi:hypothetical protein B0H14DRAFT_2664230 [Mycena olivaceomarginata]|nr:hypothetical protein B0H14DRAFT_2664230 [Mycena olivaceomarginata]